MAMLSVSSQAALASSDSYETDLAFTQGDGRCWGDAPLMIADDPAVGFGDTFGLVGLGDFVFEKDRGALCHDFLIKRHDDSLVGCMTLLVADEPRPDIQLPQCPVLICYVPRSGLGFVVTVPHYDTFTSSRGLMRRRV